MGNKTVSYASESKDEKWYIAEFTMTYKPSLKCISRVWEDCLNFIIKAFEQYDTLDKVVLKDDIVKYGKVERFIDNNFAIGTIKIAESFVCKILYHDVPNRDLRELRSEEINLIDENWMEKITQCLTNLKINQDIIQDITEYQNINARKPFYKIYDNNIYFNMSFSFN
jgi:hypothetical protein